MLETFGFLLPLVLILGGVAALAIVLTALFLRRVVPTNEVHIVQSGTATTSYGKDTGHGNTYYEWPSFLPRIGITKTVLPVSNFDIDLADYEAYDEGRLPFLVHIKAFFRISNPNEAAQRVANFQELEQQLRAVVQGAVRTILASHSIDEIMQGRSKFGVAFTEEVKHQLTSWGVETIKNIELMDIRDAKDSHVIHNIMAKKKSLIEAESRTAVAKNQQDAKLAEIAAKQTTDLADQSAAQAVGSRKIEVELTLRQQQEQAAQRVAEQRAITTEKDMSVQRVSTLRQAEITRDAQVVAAEQERQTQVIKAQAQRESQVALAEGDKATLTLRAEGTLEAKRREAEGIQLEGSARADAEKAMQLAPVQAQIVLAQEIGENQGYQTYLIAVKRIEAEQVIGVAQAAALEKADVKVIASSDHAPEGLVSAGQLFSVKGGTKLATMLEAVQQSPVGSRLVEAVLPQNTDKK